MKFHQSATLAAILVMGAAQPATAFCSDPSPPWSKPSPPTTPYCVNTWDNTHTCNDWEIDSYNRQVRAYRDEVEAYVAALQRYVDDAVEYAKCEINSLE